jgi:two-component system sensor histidine kinase YesM
MKKATIRSRLILGFCLITIPLTVLLLWNSLYATKVVHSQLAVSNKNLLIMYMNNTDSVLEEINKFLYKTAKQDTNLISLSEYDKNSFEYYEKKIQIVNELYLNSTYYNAADVLFAYSSRHDELLMAPQQLVSYDRKQAIQARLLELLRDRGFIQNNSQWMLIKLDQEYGLLRVVDTGYNSYIGAWIDLNRLILPFHQLSVDNRIQALLISNEGTPVTEPFDPNLVAQMKSIDWLKYIDQTQQTYNIIQLKERYFLVDQQSKFADIRLVLMIPEKDLLEGLTFFKQLNYLIPLIVVIILILYLVFLQRSIVRPIQNLIQGMRRVRAGNLTVRLEDHNLAEFILINETFNGMAKQIEHLKIDVYEEHIRTQKAELKHLQAQIHPHFFMNSLNIVFNLAQIKNFELIQKMALHLVKYFRFTTRTHLSTVKLSEEIEHICNYLIIQSLRFPENLVYEINIARELEDYSMPPLTIQPIVENALIHGFSVKDEEPFKVLIHVEADPQEPEDYILIHVIDNGKGIAANVLEELQSKLYYDSEEDHIGLSNVMRRCRLYYKAEISLTFENMIPKGASVSLRLPRKM